MAIFGQFSYIYKKPLYYDVKMAEKKKEIKNPYTLPTKKSIWGEVKKSVAPAGAGAGVGAGEVIGEAMFGEVAGPMIGTLGSSLFIKDEQLKKMAIFLGARKSSRNLLI